MLEGSNKLGVCDIYNIVVFNFVTICIIITLVIGIFSICHDIFLMHHNQDNPKFDPVWVLLPSYTSIFISDLHENVTPTKYWIYLYLLLNSSAYI